MAEQVELTLQIVTNLGTRLLTVVPVSISVSDAKRKIESDHFGVLGEKMGEIRISQLQVEHMGHLYGLPDDMTLAHAFAESTSSRFKPLVVEASKVEGDAQVGAVDIQGSEAAGTNAVNATGANEATAASDDSRKKKKKTKKRSHSSPAE